MADYVPQVKVDLDTPQNSSEVLLPGCIPGATPYHHALTAGSELSFEPFKAVYADASMVNSGYSDCTLRITYSAQLDKSANYGDRGNTNDVVLTWKRTNSSYYDTLVDDCHVYVFGLDLTKKFSDGKGDLSKVEFCLQNDADDYYVVAKYDETAKAYYVTGSTDDKSKATRFTPRSDGRMLIYGLEDDAYTITELKTDGAYTLLKDGIGLVISVGESSTVCDELWTIRYLQSASWI